VDLVVAFRVGFLEVCEHHFGLDHGEGRFSSADIDFRACDVGCVGFSLEGSGRRGCFGGFLLDRDCGVNDGAGGGRLELLMGRHLEGLKKINLGDDSQGSMSFWKEVVVFSGVDGGVEEAIQQPSNSGTAAAAETTKFPDDQPRGFALQC